MEYNTDDTNSAMSTCREENGSSFKSTRQTIPGSNIEHMRTILIFNPTSGSSNMANHDGTVEQHEETILAALRSYDIEPEVWYTTPDDAGNGLARKAAREGADLVIAAGGDGTIHAVANGLIGTSSTLGLIALGTMNNIARSLSIPETIEAACGIIAQGETSKVDVGQINDNIFLEVAGIGLEAELFPAAEEVKSPGLLSTVRGVLSGLATISAYQPTRFRVSFDGHRSRTYNALQITVCNTPYYGVHLQVAPGTLMDDGLLDVVIYKNFSKLEYIQHGISITQGKRILQPKITRRKVKTLHITSNQPVQIHADGIPHGHTPATITITPGALQVRVPMKTATGPSMTKPAQRETEHHKRAKEHETPLPVDELEQERGPSHVK